MIFEMVELFRQTKANSIPVYDPELPHGMTIPENHCKAFDIGQHIFFVLGFDAQHHNPGVFAGRIVPYVCEIQVKRD